MTPHGEYRIDLRQYLLGNVSEETQEQVELLVLTKKSILEEVQLLEEELIDEYVSGDLPARDRSNFEQHFLSTPERHQKLRAAITLTRHASRKPKSLPLAERIRAFWSIHRTQLIPASTAALIIVVAGLLLIPRGPTTFASVNLTVNESTRGTGAEVLKVQLPLNKDALKISLLLPSGWSPSEKYRIELDRNGEVEWLRPAGQESQSIVVIVPAKQLSPGLYELRVHAIQSDGTKKRLNGSYQFKVE